MKKENIQSRNRKLSAKARKKHPGSSSHFSPIADMIKPLEKMYGSYAGMHAAAAMGSMSSYYMPNMATAAAAAHSPGGAATGGGGGAAGGVHGGIGGSVGQVGTAPSPTGTSSAPPGMPPTSASASAAAAQFAGAGMHMMSSALGGFGAACPPSFGGMVSIPQYMR